MPKTKIEWTEYSWNPVTGCTPISEGCRNCYAERMSKRLAGRCGYPKDEPFKVTLHPERLEEPFGWRKPRRVFVCSMSDLFHEDVPDEFICRVFAAIALTPLKHTFLILTKRPQRMHEFILGLPQRDHTFRLWVAAGGEWPLSNLWLGVTAENQARADERIPVLLQIPAAKRFVSVEPMLGMVDLSIPLHIDWVICGGETGPGARPMHPDWVRSLRDQCQDAGVPFFFKQHGEWLHETQGINFHEGHRYYVWPDESMSFRVGKKAAGRILDGQIWDEMPEI